MLAAYLCATLLHALDTRETNAFRAVPKCPVHIIPAQSGSCFCRMFRKVCLEKFWGVLHNCKPLLSCECCLSALPLVLPFDAAFQHCLSTLPFDAAFRRCFLTLPFAAGRLGGLSWRRPLAGGLVPPLVPSGTPSSSSS